MAAFHQSGDGDSSGGNGELNILALSLILLVVFARTLIQDADIQAFVEGDDSHYTCYGIEDTVKQDRARAMF